MRLTTALLLAALLSNACASDEPRAPSAATTTAIESRPGELAFFLPSWLPAGMQIDDTSVQRGTDEVAAFTAAFGRPGPEGSHTDVIRVSVTAADADREVSADELQRITMVDVRGGRARMSSDGIVGAWVDWFSAGRAVSVSGPSASREQVIDAAKRVRLDAPSADGSGVDGAPPGYVLIDSGRTAGHPRLRGNLSATADGGASLHLSTQVVPPGSYGMTALTTGDDIRPLEVRGKVGVISRRDVALEGLTVESRSLTWRERDDLLVSLIGSQISEADLLEVAASLEQVDEEAFAATGKRS